MHSSKWMVHFVCNIEWAPNSAICHLKVKKNIEINWILGTTKHCLELNSGDKEIRLEISKYHFIWAILNSFYSQNMSLYLIIFGLKCYISLNFLSFFNTSLPPIVEIRDQFKIWDHKSISSTFYICILYWYLMPKK